MKEKTKIQLNDAGKYSTKITIVPELGSHRENAFSVP